jgi:hypothetical protein
MPLISATRMPRGGPPICDLGPKSGGRLGRGIDGGQMATQLMGQGELAASQWFARDQCALLRASQSCFPSKSCDEACRILRGTIGPDVVTTGR